MKNEKMNIQEAMFSEIREKRIFEKAQQYAYQYLDQVFERNVFPTEEALKNLGKFEEDMPLAPTQAESVIDFLDAYSSPATGAQIGGRCFGFVNGSAVPAGLAAKNLATYWDQNTAMQVLCTYGGKATTKHL